MYFSDDNVCLIRDFSLKALRDNNIIIDNIDEYINIRQEMKNMYRKYTYTNYSDNYDEMTIDVIEKIVNDITSYETMKRKHMRRKLKSRKYRRNMPIISTKGREHMRE